MLSAKLATSLERTAWAAESMVRMSEPGIRPEAAEWSTKSLAIRTKPVGIPEPVKRTNEWWKTSKVWFWTKSAAATSELIDFPESEESVWSECHAQLHNPLPARTTMLPRQDVPAELLLELFPLFLRQWLQIFQIFHIFKTFLLFFMIIISLAFFRGNHFLERTLWSPSRSVASPRR
jgi:hypothetical protein